MMTNVRHGLYGLPPRDLADYPDEAVQFSPLIPGADDLEKHENMLQSLTMLAPPGTVERRAALALGLRALSPGASLTTLALKDKGGSRIAKDLKGLGCVVQEKSKRHYRICTAGKPDVSPDLDAAIAEGAPRFVEDIGLWSQPGIFSWDRLDPGSVQLVERLPPLSGRGADFGCGTGYLAHGVLASPAVSNLQLIDIDRRAIEAARRNVDDPRVSLQWADVRKVTLPTLDFIVMNPPFHDGGIEDKALGKAFIEKAASILRRGGRLWLVANKHLPYEALLAQLFARFELQSEAQGFKVYEAVK
ncbi:methyltransferase [Agaricicola taiwanensis]|uniref:Methyltransferase n=1 Tax=Agaricicola taiwanensis TaxID=591372 RepID=A0A8J2YH60_9RHOB|nr:methyltransferase [Agaricicola taiwanensis]GGE40938.1 methyltransferase [Agaricicola taiwanensis]